MPWSTSARRKELPPDWSKIRAAVKRRARGLCEADTHHPTCDGIGRECDHIGDKLDHSLANLQWLSHPCHRAKTLLEAQEASKRKRKKLSLPSESHPGRTWG